MENQSLLNNPQQMVLRGKGQVGGTLEERFQANFLRFEPQGWKAQALNAGAEMQGWALQVSTGNRTRQQEHSSQGAVMLVQKEDSFPKSMDKRRSGMGF